MFSTQPCDGVDDDGGVAVVKVGVGVAAGHHEVGAKLGAAVTSTSLRQLWPLVVPQLPPRVVADHLGVVHPASDGHEGGVVDGQGAGAVQRMGKVGTPQPGGIARKENLAGPLGIPSAKQEHLA